MCFIFYLSLIIYKFPELTLRALVNICLVKSKCNGCWRYLVSSHALPLLNFVIPKIYKYDIFLFIFFSFVDNPCFSISKSMLKSMLFPKNCEHTFQFIVEYLSFEIKSRNSMHLDSLSLYRIINCKSKFWRKHFKT